jgi:hypothetical protein
LSPSCEDAAVTYREDREAMESRIVELEAELATAKETIVRLRGEAEREIPPDDVDPFTGVSRFLHLERELPFEISDEGCVAISDLLNQRIPGGSISQVGNTLTHSKASYALRLTRGERRTSIRLEGDYRAARTLLALGSPGLAFLGAALFGVSAAAITAGHAAVIALSAVLGAVVGFVFLRGRVKRAMAKDRQGLCGAFEGVVELASAHARPRPGMRLEAAKDTRDALSGEEATLAGEEAMAEAAEQTTAERRA